MQLGATSCMAMLGRSISQACFSGSGGVFHRRGFADDGNWTGQRASVGRTIDVGPGVEGLGGASRLATTPAQL